LLAAILAAIMSTIDSQLLVCSSTIAEDFYKQILRKEASQNELVWISRIAVIVIALIAILLASNPDSKVLGLVSYAWGGFGAAFGPVVILSLFWRRMTRNGTLVGMILGAVTVIVWKQLKGGIFDMYEILPGFILCTLAIVIVSFLDKVPSQEVVGIFDKDLTG
jgi:sodium/proline symporter